MAAPVVSRSYERGPRTILGSADNRSRLIVAGQKVPHHRIEPLRLFDEGHVSAGLKAHKLRVGDARMHIPHVRGCALVESTRGDESR